MTLDYDAPEDKKGVDNLGFSKNVQSRSNHSSMKERPLSGKDSSGESKLEKAEMEKTPEKKVDLSCGIWKFRTNLFGSKFANLYVFTLFMGLSMLFTQMVHSVLHVQLTSIERQFKINNAKAGLFDTASKAGNMATILLAGHFAKKVNIPVVIGLAGMFQGIILMIPAFMQIANPYTLPLLEESFDKSTNTSGHGDNEKYYCYTSNHSNFLDNGKSDKHSEPSAEYNHAAYVVILIVQAFKGVTDTFHSGFLPTLYVDDNILDKTRMGIFFAIKYILGELASPVGKQLNAIMTQIPVDLKPTEMQPKDQRFVAAWWLAFLIFGGATTIFSFPILLFPRKLVSKKQQQEALDKAMITFTVGEEKEEKITDKMKTSDALRTPSITIIGVEKGISASDRGTHSFTPRSSVKKTYSHVSQRKASLFPPVHGAVERKISADGSMAFDQPAREKRPTEDKGGKTQSSIMELLKDFPVALGRVFRRPVFLLILVEIAMLSIPMSGTAIFRSIYMTSEFNVSMTEVASLTGITSAVSHVIGTLLSGWLTSKVKTKVGYMKIIISTSVITIAIMPLYLIFGCDNQPIYGHDGSFGMPANVTDICGCNITQQLISCGDDGNNYLTPCHAGCLTSVGKIFSNCSGLSALALNQSMTLVPGLCATPCRRNFYLHVAVSAIQGMFFSISSIPRRLMILRIVDPRDRAFSTSLFSFFSNLLSIPSPNLFGRVIDDTCLVKDGDVCTLYDRDKIRYLMAGIDVGVHSCGQIVTLMMLFLFKWEERKMRKQMKKEKEEEETADKEQDGRF